MQPKTRLIAITIVIVLTMLFLMTYPFIKTFHNLDYHKINEIENKLDYYETTGAIDKSIREQKIAQLKKELLPIKERFDKSNDGSTLYYVEVAVVTLAILLILWIVFLEYPGIALAFTIFTMLMVGHILLKHIGIDLMLAEHRRTIGIIIASILVFILLGLGATLAYRLANFEMNRMETLLKNPEYISSYAESVAYKHRANNILAAMGKYLKITKSMESAHDKVNSMDFDVKLNKTKENEKEKTVKDILAEIRK